jgi:hypothetical protein
MAEKPIFVFPVPKSPFPTKGRFGEVGHQDWYRGLKKAVDLAEKTKGRVLVITGFKADGYMSEADCYQRVLKILGKAVRDLVVIEKGQETAEELEIAIELAKEKNARLIVISTFMHYPRVRWICRGQKIEHWMVFGLPRIREFFTDLLMWFAYPIIETAGKKEVFIEWVNKRRKGGKF